MKIHHRLAAISEKFLPNSKTIRIIWMASLAFSATLALLPWLVLAFYSGWIYNSLAGIDHWIYFGYFLNYPRYVAEWFPDRYYGSRLPWVLPGYLLHLFFDPKTARYILHLGFYYIAVFSLYALLRKAVGARTALLTSVLFGTYSFFLAAIGWDYVDGAGLTYNLLALLCMERAANSSRPRLWLAASGVAAAAMFYCNVFLVVFWPMLPAFYIYQVYQGFSKSTLRLAIRFALWFGFGVLLVTLVLGTVNYAVGGGFWFYAPSLAFFRSSGSKPNPWFQPGWHWAVQAGWLAFPLVTVLGSAFYVILGILRRTFGGRDPRLFFAVQYLACAAIMIGWQMAGGLGLAGYHYNSYLLPSAFLALGCMLATHFEDWPAAIYWLFLLTVCVAFAVSLKLTMLSVANQIRDLGWFPIALCLGLCFVLNNVLRNRWQMLLLILGGFWICQLAFRMGYPGSEHSATIWRGSWKARKWFAITPAKIR